MKAARVRRTLSETVKMMVVRNERIEHSWITQLGAYLTAGDVVVVNDAATLPASLAGHLVDGSALEIRLLSQIGEGLWQVVAFGEGNWLIPTEDRQPPVPLHQGEEIIFSDGFSAEVMEISARSERLLTIRFKVPRENFWRGLYRTGRPVQYSYMSRGLELWSVQNVYSSRPWAIEMPSAGHAFTWDLMLALMGKGVRVVGLTHAAGISSTGDERIDQELPLRERFEIPAGTIAAIENAKANGHRIIAIGTSVVRALESYAIGLTETTDLKIGSGFKLRLVDGLLTGTHDASESHYQLLSAFLPSETLQRVASEFEREGYLTHEFGDLCLVGRQLSVLNDQWSGSEWSVASNTSRPFRNQLE